MSNAASKQRPVYRNIHVTQILRYRLPLAGQLSILHRVSGALLFLALPVILLPMFDRSISSEISFEEMKGIVSSPFVKIVLLGLIWAYMHHFCAGIRYLVLDLHIGTDKDSARKSAAVSFGISLVLTAVFGLKLFGVF